MTGSSRVDAAAAQLGGLGIAVANDSAMAVPYEGEGSRQRSFTTDMTSTVRPDTYLTSSAARQRRS